MKRGHSPDVAEDIIQKKTEQGTSHHQQDKFSWDEVARDQEVWGLWGPYLPERQWGTVREDTSVDGNCWESVSHDAAAATAYRSGEDGLLGICDQECHLCSSLAVWNQKDACLKERLFGLTNPQGNHGEDVKELYYYLDNNPRHSYMRALYKYPMQRFPYETLVAENAARDAQQQEFELLDTGIFDDDQYWDIFVEYAKMTSRDVICSAAIVNKSSKTQTITVLPQVWLRNTWALTSPSSSTSSAMTSPIRPSMSLACGQSEVAVHSITDTLGDYVIKFYESEEQTVEVVFTDNDSQPLSEPHLMDELQTRESSRPVTKFFKDGISRYLIKGDSTAVNKEKGTKCAAIINMTVPPGGREKIYWTVFHQNSLKTENVATLEEVIRKRKAETKIFYAKLMKPEWSTEEENIARQAVAGLLWSKQFYLYDVEASLQDETVGQKYVAASSEGSSPGKQKQLRNSSWRHIKNHDVIAVPDKWEFPWYATWDMAFHVIPYSRIDLDFAKQQLELFLSHRYMKGNGQLPGCEFDLDDPNPPLHAWACLAVYRTDGDADFLSRCYNRLKINYNWWLSKLDRKSTLYSGGGFLGMDNISVINRSADPPAGYTLLQADGTAWTAMCSLNMLDMALQLMTFDQSAIDQSEIYVKKFLQIAVQMNKDYTNGGLWHSEDNFYYDVLRRKSENVPIRVMSLVGLVSLFAASIIEVPIMPRTQPLIRLLDNCNSDERKHVYKMSEGKYYLSLVPQSRLLELVRKVCDTSIFLSPYGIRSLAKVYEKNPYKMEIVTKEYQIAYSGGESNDDMFGGNSNWRGPVWLCMNYMLMNSLDVMSDAYGHSLTVEHPTKSGSMVSLCDIAADIASRIVNIFLPNQHGHRPLHGGAQEFYSKPDWQQLILFYEYFHADTGRGCGASHQTGWTSLILEFLHRKHQHR